MMVVIYVVKDIPGGPQADLPCTARSSDPGGNQ